MLWRLTVTMELSFCFPEAASDTGGAWSDADLLSGDVGADMAPASWLLGVATGIGTMRRLPRCDGPANDGVAATAVGLSGEACVPSISVAARLSVVGTTDTAALLPAEAAAVSDWASDCFAEADGCTDVLAAASPACSRLSSAAPTTPEMMLSLSEQAVLSAEQAAMPSSEIMDDCG